MDGDTLLNMAGIWISTANWEIPSPGSTGNVKNVDTGMVLGVKDDVFETGTEVIEEALIADDAGQQWQVAESGVADFNAGFFTITNPASRKVLTAVNDNKLTIEGKNKLL